MIWLITYMYLIIGCKLNVEFMCVWPSLAQYWLCILEPIHINTNLNCMYNYHNVITCMMIPFMLYINVTLDIGVTWCFIWNDTIIQLNTHGYTGLWIHSYSDIIALTRMHVHDAINSTTWNANFFHQVAYICLNLLK